MAEELMCVDPITPERRVARARIVAMWRALRGEPGNVDLIASDLEWTFWETLLAADPEPQWRREFSDFPADQMPPIPAEWTDESWHNDVCPHFTVAESEGRVLSVWVDFPNPAEREFPDWLRFRATVDNADGTADSDLVVETDRWDELLAATESKKREMI